MSKLLRAWMRVAKKITLFQATVLLFVLFVVILVPLGFFMRHFFRKKLLGFDYVQKEYSYWVLKPSLGQNLSLAKRQ